jgi:hypothetical protein
MKKNGAIKTYDGGRLIFEPLQEDENDTIQWQASMTEVNMSPQDEFGGAEYTPKLLTASTVLPWTDRWDNSGSSQVIDLWKAKLNSTKESLTKEFNTTILAADGTDPLRMLGLPVIVAATGTYGGIDRSTNTFWQSYVEATPGPLTDDDIRHGANVVSRNYTNEGPDVHATTQILYEKYESMLLPAYRFTNKAMADLGFANNTLQWNGKPVIWDSFVDTGVWYFLNTKWFSIRPHSQANFEMTERLNPQKQLVDGLFHYFYGASTSKGPRFLGKLTGRTA